MWFATFYIQYMVWPFRILGYPMQKGPQILGAFAFCHLSQFTAWSLAQGRPDRRALHQPGPLRHLRSG
jgi:hypothetical protein